MARRTISDIRADAFAAIMSQGAQIVRASAEEFLKKEYIPMLMRYANQMARKEVKGDIDFTFTVTIRAYRDTQIKKHSLAAKYFTKYAEFLTEGVTKFMASTVLINIKKSFDRGGPSPTDIEKKPRWKKHSKSYVKYRKKKKVSPLDKLGHFTGEMIGGLSGFSFDKGAVTIHFEGQRLGARTFTVDFSGTPIGRKLARFYFGRRSAWSYQPPRMFTFMRKGDFKQIEKWLAKSFRLTTIQLNEFFAGVTVGRLPGFTRTGILAKPLFRRLPIEPARWVEA